MGEKLSQNTKEVMDMFESRLLYGNRPDTEPFVNNQNGRNSKYIKRISWVGAVANAPNGVCRKPV